MTTAVLVLMHIVFKQKKERVLTEWLLLIRCDFILASLAMDGKELP